MLNIGSSDHMTDRRVIEDIKKIGLNNPTCFINSKFCFITKKANLYQICYRLASNL